MIWMSILPQIQTRDEYQAAFPNSELWLKAASRIAGEHRLNGSPVRAVLGSNIVYRVGNHWIKLFAPLYESEFEIELAGLETVAAQNDFAVPRIFAKGVFDGWPYMVLSHVDGVRIGDVWPNLSDELKAGLAEQIAVITRKLQRLEAPEGISRRFDWNQFIGERFEHSVATQVSKGLSADSARKLEKFVSQFRIGEFQCAAPVYLHADLTHDHFLVDAGMNRVVGIIDFADSMAGHPEYDLAAYFCYLFHGHKGAQESFYAAWGDRLSPERILMWIVLHRFSDLNRYFGVNAFDRFADFNDFARERFA